MCISHTQRGRDKNGRDAAREQRESDVETEREYEAAAEKRREKHDEEAAEQELSDDT